MRRILLIEDDEDYQQLVQAVLAGSEGEFEVQGARTLADGIAATQSFAPDLVLVDLNLPDSRGYDTFLRVREQAEGSPIVVLTGMDDDQIALRAVEDGAQDYLVKSLIQPKLIARCVNMALSRQRRQIERTGASSRKPALVHGFIGSKGGVGTSTTALNVAAVLARNGQQTLLVELQPGPGSLSMYLQKDPVHGLASLLEKPAAEITAADVQHCLVEPVRGLYVLCPGAWSGPWPSMDAAWVQALISAARLVCSQIVLDLAPRLDAGVAAALPLCDSITLIVDREPASVRRGAAMMEQIESIAPACEARLVLVNRTMLDMPLPLADIKNQLKTDPLVVILPAASCISLSHTARTPLVMLFPDDSFSFAYIELAERLLAPAHARPVAVALAGAR